MSWPESHLKPRTEGPLLGQIFILTGTLKSMSREQAKTKLTALGAKLTESVSGKTDYVIIGENSGSKLTKAKALGIKIMHEEEFLSLIHQWEVDHVN